MNTVSNISLICMDLEASGLGPRSYPIEVAWKCAATGESDSFLINPESAYGWNDWDPVAAEIHGISREELKEEGISVREACKRLNQFLGDREVISDALEFDYFWMRRLFEAGMMKPTFKMQGIDHVLEGEQLIQYRLVASAQVRTHRAMNDVDDLIKCLAACDIGVESLKS